MACQAHPVVVFLPVFEGCRLVLLIVEVRKLYMLVRVAQNEAFFEKLTSLGGLVFLLGRNKRKIYLK